MRICFLIVVFGLLNCSIASATKYVPSNEEILITHGVKLEEENIKTAAVNHANPRVRVAAIRFLSDSNVNLESSLISKVFQDENALVRVVAAKEYYEISSVEALSVLQLEVASGESDAAFYASSTLCEFGYEEGSKGLIEHAKSDNWFTRKLALLSLRTCREQFDVDSVYFYSSDDPDSRVRIVALETLASRQDVRVIKLLISKLDDNDYSVRYGAGKWLREITGLSSNIVSSNSSESAQLEISKWNDWLAKNEDRFRRQKNTGN